jgi:hypothetical protein
MRRPGPPFERFARSVGAAVPMSPETRALVRKAAEGEATPEEVRALVALGGWRAAADRLEREKPALVGEALDYAYAHAVGLDMRVTSFARLLGKADDAWLAEHVESLRELRTQLAKWRRELGR